MERVTPRNETIFFKEEKMLKAVTSVCFSLIVLMFSPFANAESVFSAETFLLAKTLQYSPTATSTYTKQTITAKTTANSCSDKTCLTCNGSQCLTCISGYKLTQQSKCVLCPNGCHIKTGFDGGGNSTVTITTKCVKDEKVNGDWEDCHTKSQCPTPPCSLTSFGVCKKTYNGKDIPCDAPCPVGCTWNDGKTECMKSSDKSKKCF